MPVKQPPHGILSVIRPCSGRLPVDAAYGKTVFKTEAERVAFLFERYQRLIAPLVMGEKKGKKTRRKEPDNNVFDEQSV